MNTATLTFMPDGTGHGLYTEIIELGSIGPLSIERATVIEFNGRTQEWEVREPGGSFLYSNPSRANCMEWEHQRFAQRNLKQFKRKEKTSP